MGCRLIVVWADKLQASGHLEKPYQPTINNHEPNLPDLWAGSSVFPVHEMVRDGTQGFRVAGKGIEFGNGLASKLLDPVLGRGHAVNGGIGQFVPFRVGSGWLSKDIVGGGFIKDVVLNLEGKADLFTEPA